MNSGVLRVVPLDLSRADHGSVFLELLDHYAHDPMGGGTGLNPAVREELIPRLQSCSGFHSALAYLEDDAVGLINCFAGFSTFAARPLLNIHDIVVHAKYRQSGIGQALLAWAEGRARELGCCKLTLEVLSNNRRALASYQRAGFAPYQLDPAAGQALFLQKKIP